MQTRRFYTLSGSCPDQVGIISRISGFIAQHNGWILESSYHADDGNDGHGSRYFMRMQVKADSLPFHLAEFRERFAPLAAELSMEWKISDSAVKRRVVLMVSKQEHCLYDLLARWQSKELDIEIPCVISNHDTFKAFVEWHGIPFHHVPISADNKIGAHAEICRIYDEVRGDTMVLARYMQILPPEMCARYPGQMINIHHSFLPSFVGARPYHQAFQRGVKLIGATCHYVTRELDQGPIIEQDVIRIDHSDSVEDMVRYGKDIEKAVLARGLRYHLEDRVLLHANKTVIFR
ncbi:MAG: Formyltetrahydrofolate deformylase [Candidatus Accumulibacter regalis]|jgi:formyltetrahydrofolate deformylase|uniref:Formyltetrahydrofolate deformylase n=1 Tax=Accumulibacter regalis TaxID=522306 RepID=A0A011QHP8_ACCRE|nr:MULTISPECIES: formyltetrahydrofolate deformylase [unclassified Candidatus Accumulibacter]EXI88545.1 MAG: Formyltetrahydrofolate deformylase [Candidatus Accumulibacter regalis]MQM32885.1 formyltetrahydrofolate deformylase [Candidatus Accumulibacter phosphatis]MBL8369166.1 formyltetrahydrofolate deformylase [Accumulibacter sp.]MBN8514918.1 formyltetrahydrofolate deformylase [Accumulibacter sp.]MBO3702192.1 formyltetrahydrofolate deformylase [Accumulibacter sp.]